MGAHMKTTVVIADPLLREAKRTAAREGVTLRELIEQGLRRVLDDRQRRGSAAFVLKDCRNRQAKLQPGIREGDWDQLRELLYTTAPENSR